MKIGIDGSFWASQRRGYDRYCFELARELDTLLPNAQFFVYSPRSIELPIMSDRWQLRTAGSKLAVSPVSWLKIVGSYLARRDKLDVFWGTAYFLPYLSQTTKQILTIHDFWYQISPKSTHWLHVLAQRIFLKSEIRRADALVTNSQGTATRLYSFTGHKSTVILPAINELFQPQSQSQVDPVLQRFGIDTPYLLNVATWEPRKNVGLLVKTFIGMKQVGLIPNHKLLLVGKKGWDYAYIQALIADSGLKQIIALDYVPDEFLPGLYAGADLFVFPSIYEGFGMPLLEARACGTQSVATDITELREAGGSDTTYIQPTEEGLRAGILAALRKPKTPPKSTAMPTWQAGAQTLANIIIEAAQR